jgi:hypothetical protein
MSPILHAVVVHYAPLVAEAIADVLSCEGYTAHRATTMREGRVLLDAIARISVVIAHPDLVDEPEPGALIWMARTKHPEALVVVISTKSFREIGTIPKEAVFLLEPFDRAQLLRAIDRS